MIRMPADGRIAMPRVFLIVHGIVQGVGYRALVSGCAARCGIRGFVRNAEDGSVEILCEAKKEAVDKFVREINVDTEHGPRVFRIEIGADRLDDFKDERYEGFSISESA